MGGQSRGALPLWETPIAFRNQAPHPVRPSRAERNVRHYLAAAVMERVPRSADAIARRAFVTGVSSLPGARALFIEVALHDTCTSSALCLRAFADPAFLAEHGVRKVVPLPSSRSDTLMCTVSPRAAVFLLLGASALGARNIIKALRLRAQE